MVSTTQVRKLRDLTGAGIMDCKKALQEAEGDLKVAAIILRQMGLVKLKERTEKSAKEGIIDSYIHAQGRIGVLVEINCETDFVAKNAQFKDFAHNIALHIAASNPLYISKEQIPAQIIQVKFKKGQKEESKNFFEKVCLLQQPYVKNPEISVEEYLGEMVSKLGEKIAIKRFVRFELGESNAKI